ncbi:MAG TPA: hypothetical protein VHT93_10520 [Pseudolabrys sp.]|nr:hypothetical protein [Pseudolabrys sp.]
MTISIVRAASGRGQSGSLIAVPAGVQKAFARGTRAEILHWSALTRARGIERAPPIRPRRRGVSGRSATQRAMKAVPDR